MTVTLSCDQAIFTSIRGPMGEGYRIVAASKGLRVEEKQAITRYSPSHDALCWTPTVWNEDSIFAAAFYRVSTGRLVVAYSCYAGAEHTGRGGHRVYTHNVVFDESEFPACGYNPFNVLRAMIVAELNHPELKPSPLLPDLTLKVESDPAATPAASAWTSLDARVRGIALTHLLDQRNMVLPLATDWAAAAETLYLGVPGPLRNKVSLGAGLRFSVGRCHRLHVFHDEKGAARVRLVGQPVEYVTADPPPPGKTVKKSAWLTFVDRHWAAGDAPALSRRTSQAFGDPSPLGRERIGLLYNTLDAVTQTPTAELLELGLRHLRERADGAENAILRQLVTTARGELCQRFVRTPWRELRPLWSNVASAWRRGGDDAAFVWPFAEKMLRALAVQDPLAAGEAALEFAAETPAGIAAAAHDALMDEVLTRLCDQAASVQPQLADRLIALGLRWQPHRARRPKVLHLAALCESLRAAQVAT